MLAELRRQALATLRPPTKLPLAQWLESEMRLPDTVSALPGPVRLWPYQVGIADAISDPDIERVTIVKPVRVGFTTLLSGALASYVANEPAPILALLPTIEDCRNYVVSNLDPVFDATPSLRGLLSLDADGTKRSTMLARRFPGGSLKIKAAKSPRNLRADTVRILLIDEADAMEPSKEGDPIVLAEKRTLSYGNRKIIMGSTPVHEETSNVLRAYANSDSRIFEVPCASCGAFTEILWEHIEWEDGRPETAAFRCPHCRELIAERHKSSMVAAGRWRATRPDVRRHAGFRLNALVSCMANAAWLVLVGEFLAAKGHPDKLQGFVNTILAQGWTDLAGERLNESDLAARAQPWGLAAVSADVLAITVGVDVQHDRLEAVTLGHGRDDRAFVLAYETVWGSPLVDTTWTELDDLLKRTWPHPGGGTLRVDSAIVDAGDGGMADVVHAFTRPRFGARRIASGKGDGGWARPRLERSSKKGVPLFIVGVDTIKVQLLNRLAAGGEAIRFSADLPPRFYEELTSEILVTRYQAGRPVKRFERISGRRAESLDCVVYAIAARELLRLDFDRRDAELATPAALAPVRSNVVRSAWLSR